MPSTSSSSGWSRTSSIHNPEAETALLRRFGFAGMMTAFGNMNIANIDTILDSGATCNIFKERSMFYDYVPVVGEYVLAANGYKLPIHGRGSVALSCGLDLIECCHVPTVTKNLIAESYITNEIRARITKLDTTAVIDRLPKGCTRREIVIYQLNLLCVLLLVM